MSYEIKDSQEKRIGEKRVRSREVEAYRQTTKGAKKFAKGVDEIRYQQNRIRSSSNIPWI